MDAWIEILDGMSFSTFLVRSHPAWLCGLKSLVVMFKKVSLKVAPCVGVWIETFLFSAKNNKKSSSIATTRFDIKNYNILCLLELLYRRKIRLSDNTACSFQSCCS